MTMTRTEYVKHLQALYRIANMSDAHDDPDRPDWLKGDESATHCQQLDKIVREMGLGDNWLEEDDFEPPRPMTLEEFRATRKRVCSIGEHTCNEDMYETPGYVYLGDQWWIELTEDGRFWVLVDNLDFMGTLDEAERWLFSTVIDDNGQPIRR